LFINVKDKLQTEKSEIVSDGKETHLMKTKILPNTHSLKLASARFWSWNQRFAPRQRRTELPREIPAFVTQFAPQGSQAEQSASLKLASARFWSWNKK
jgi:hypothetical protein